MYRVKYLWICKRNLLMLSVRNPISQTTQKYRGLNFITTFLFSKNISLAISIRACRHNHVITYKSSAKVAKLTSYVMHSRCHDNQWWGGRVNSWCFSTIRKTGNMWGLRGGDSPFQKREKRPFWRGRDTFLLSEIDHVTVLFDVMGPYYGCCVCWGYFT